MVHGVAMAVERVRDRELCFELVNVPAQIADDCLQLTQARTGVGAHRRQPTGSASAGTGGIGVPSAMTDCV
jgi:hypothetical protein